MTKKDLVDISTRPHNEAQAIRSMGGKTRSIGKKVAARLREIKKKVAKGEVLDAQYQELLDFMTDSELSEMNMASNLIKLKHSVDDPNFKLKVNKSLLELHKTKHGTKDKTDININTVEQSFNFNLVMPKLEDKE